MRIESTGSRLNRTVRIGVDCRPLVGDKTGIGYYLWEILDEWARAEIDFVELYLYASKPFELPSAFANTRLLYRKRVRRLSPGELWAQTALPVLVARDGIDVFWGPNFCLPLLCHVPTVLTIHDMVYKVLPDTMMRKTYYHNAFGLPLYARKSQKILVPSVNTKLDVVKYLRVAEDRVVVTPLGMPKRFRQELDTGIILSHRFGLEMGSYILAVGTVEPRKNLERVVRAFRLARKAHPDMKLVVAGTLGWASEQTQSALQDEGVIYVGYVSDVELMALYKGCRFFVYVPLYEGFGMPPLEAMAVGKPVLTANNSSLPEVVGRAAILVDATREECIREGMSLLWVDGDLRERLSEQALARARKFSWDETAQKTLNVILNVVGAQT